MNEYVIIDKTVIQKKIEELKQQRELAGKNLSKDTVYIHNQISTEIRIYEQLLSQSIPLIPEIEKAYEAGKLDEELSLSFDNPKGRYISNLKFDI